MTHSRLDAIEDLELSAWPGLASAHSRGWLIRLSRGFTRRANSAMALRHGADLGPAELADVEALYARHGRPAIVRVTHKAAGGLDDRLAARGYTLLTPSEVRIAPIGDLRPDAAPNAAPDAAPDAAIVVSATLPDTWVADFGAANGRPDFDAAAMAGIIANIVAPAGFARLAEAGETIAVGMAVVLDGLVELQSIAVRPHRRGRGLGRRILAALMAWGADNGAREAVLSVEAANAPAIRLYDSLGFKLAGRYHYRLQPTSI